MGSDIGGHKQGLVADNFSRGADYYHEDACWHRDWAQALLDFSEEQGIGNEFNNILEIGAGSGFLTALLLARFQNASLLAVDNSEGMLECWRDSIAKQDRQRAKCLLADAQNMMLEANAYDGVFSASAMHWLPDLAEALQRYHACLKPGGRLVFSHFSPETYHEFYAHCPDSILQARPYYRDEATLRNLLEATGFVDITFESRSDVLSYDSALELLHDIRDMGFGPLGEQPLAQGEMRRLIRAIDDQDMITLTYQLSFVSARRPLP